MNVNDFSINILLETIFYLSYLTVFFQDSAIRQSSSLLLFQCCDVIFVGLVRAKTVGSSWTVKNCILLFRNSKNMIH